MKNKSSNQRIFEVNIKTQQYRNQATENLLSPKGIEMRVNRSSQVEGAFGVLKQDMNYDRFRRISLKKASCEFMITVLAYNIRKYILIISGKGETEYWKIPENLEPEKIKKPSAKRLSKKAKKKKKKSVNETARASKKRKKEAVNNSK